MAVLGEIPVDQLWDTATFSVTKLCFLPLSGAQFKLDCVYVSKCIELLPCDLFLTLRKQQKHMGVMTVKARTTVSSSYIRIIHWL